MKQICVDSPAAKNIFDKREFLRKVREENNGKIVNANRLTTPAIPECEMENKITNILSNGCWAGRRCFIIGGGPSLKGFNFDKLQDELTIGINAVYQKFDPIILFGMDKRFFEWAECKGIKYYGKNEKEKNEFLERYNNLTAIKLHLNVEKADFENVYKIDCMGNLGLSASLSNGLCHGENSGYAALNLAYILGCNPIYLLGFDMDGDKKYHWHDGHPGQAGTGDMSTFPIAFNQFADEIKKKTRVINLNKESKLKCFEFGNMPIIKKKPIIVTSSLGLGENNLLKQRLQKYGLRHYFDKSGNDKSKIIKSCMKEFRRDIAWIDSSAIISSFPEEIFKFKGDFGTFKNHIGNSRELSGLLYFKKNVKGNELINKWNSKRDLNEALKDWSGKVGYFIRKNESEIIIPGINKPEYKSIKYNKKWILISYYTIGTSYEKEIRKLINSLSNHEIDYCIFGKKPLGTWRENLNYKSETILQAFKMFPNKDIVFVDSDAIINRYPSIFDELSNDEFYNIGAAFHNYRQSTGPGSLLSGTLWFKNNNMTQAIVNRWHKKGLQKKDIRHQHCLRLAIEETMMDGNLLFVYRLPTAYTYIFDYNYGKIISPVITHYQASRRLKKEVGDSPLRDSNFTAKQEGYVRC
jgi:hypothetical protein